MKAPMFFSLGVLALGLASGITSPAAAGPGLDPDDEYCWTNEETGEVECMNVGFMRKVCKLTDPNNVGEECQDVAESKVPSQAILQANQQLKRVVKPRPNIVQKGKRKFQANQRLKRVGKPRSKLVRKGNRKFQPNQRLKRVGKPRPSIVRKGNRKFQPNKRLKRVSKPRTNSVRKGNRKVSVTLSGQVHSAVQRSPKRRVRTR